MTKSSPAHRRFAAATALAAALALAVPTVAWAAPDTGSAVSSSDTGLVGNQISPGNGVGTLRANVPTGTSNSVMVRVTGPHHRGTSKSPDVWLTWGFVA